MLDAKLKPLAIIFGAAAFVSVASCGGGGGGSGDLASGVSARSTQATNQCTNNGGTNNGGTNNGNGNNGKNNGGTNNGSTNNGNGNSGNNNGGTNNGGTNNGNNQCEEQPVDPRSLNAIVAGMDDWSVPEGVNVPITMMGQMKYLFDRVKAEGLDLTMSLGPDLVSGNDINVKVLGTGTGDKFLPGKLALGLSYVLIDMKAKGDPAYAEYLAVYQDITKKMMAKNDQGKYIYDNTSFGEYYYLLALNMFKDKGMLDEVFSDTALMDTLKERLKYDDMFTQPSAPNFNINTALNYYGVAYAIAGLRDKLGWGNADDAGRGANYARNAILEKLLDHYRNDSSGGFNDDADGRNGGRFDRYSVLLIGEVVERSIEMGNEAAITDEVKGYLRKSVNAILPQLTTEGLGFNYGRSIGPYGDTAFMEVLTAALNAGILTDEERKIAYAFIERVADRYANFWYDKDLRSVNMWVKGRGTDSYRGTARALGENFSLLHQFLYVNAHWNRLGYKNAAPISIADFQQWLDSKQPRYTLTWYNDPNNASYPNNEALITVRDKKRVFNLNLARGADYNQTTPYFPVPFANNITYGTADQSYALLLPRVTTGSNHHAPVSYFKNLKVVEDGGKVIVSYDVDQLRRITAKNQTNFLAIGTQTTFTFEPGSITRTDVMTPTANVSNATVQMDFATFADASNAVMGSDGYSVTYSNSDVASYSIAGLDTCTEPKAFGSVALSLTPIGQLKANFSCKSTGVNFVAGQSYTYSWTLKYNDLP